MSLLIRFSTSFQMIFLIMIDESHMTMGQIKGMYNGDRSRKEMLVNYGSVCRLPWTIALLRREEFESHVHQIVYVQRHLVTMKMNRPRQ